MTGVGLCEQQCIVSNATVAEGCIANARFLALALSLSGGTKKKRKHSWLNVFSTSPVGWCK